MKKRIVAAIILGMMMLTMSPMALATSKTKEVGEIVMPENFSKILRVNTTQTTPAISVYQDKVAVKGATLSAMVAGLRGSSSGMCASVLPTRSAPMSAALV